MPEFRIVNFDLAAGGCLPEVTIAFQTYGHLSAARDNAILVTHGLTSSHLAAEPPTLDRRIGWGREQIRPGLLYDTDRYFVISSNVLGSSYGSTCAASATRRPVRHGVGTFHLSRWKTSSARRCASSDPLASPG